MSVVTSVVPLLAVLTTVMPNQYLKLGQYWSPVLVHAGRDPASFPTSYNFDGDWYLANNKEHFLAGMRDPNAVIYLDAFETETDYVLIYTVYNPLDSQKPYNKIKQGQWVGPLLAKMGAYWAGGGPHEHDNEGAVLFIRKSPDHEFGEFRLMLTKFHNWNVPYTVDPKDLHLLEKNDAQWNVGIPTWQKLLSRVRSLKQYLHHMNPQAQRHHDRSEPIHFVTDSLGQHPLLFVGPSELGHGILKYNPKVRSNGEVVYSIAGGEGAVPYQLVPSIETILDCDPQQLGERFLITDQPSDFVPWKHGPKPFVNLPKNLKAKNDQRDASFFWGWGEAGSYIGIDPVGYLYERLFNIAMEEKMSTQYVFNPYQIGISSNP